jgi:beta-1,4-mannosyl-glycoprotein beta-1,4-N-acetylglucosaminyltransferase
LLPKIIRRRNFTRRLIYGLPVNHEFDLFEARMAMQADVVDVFIIHESNYTNSGKPKPVHFLNMFREQEWLKQYHQKIVYIFQDSFPKEGFLDGKIADAFMRRNLGQSAFNKHLKGVNDDDMFIYNDGDELIRPEILTFLKLYEGFTDPIGFKYRWAIFGFFWTIKFESKYYKYRDFECAAMSVGFFKDFYNYDASLIRGSEFKTENDKNRKAKAIYKNKGKRIEMFNCSQDAGWHCSYCFKPEGIRKKLLDAPLSDWPRWGDDPKKCSVDYIKLLIKNGQNFDEKYLRGSGNNMLTEMKDPEFAPQFMINHPEKFNYLLKNPYT